MKTYKELTSDIRTAVIEKYRSGENPKEFAALFELHPDIAYQILYEENLVKAREYVPNYKSRSFEWKQAVADYYMKPHTRFETKDFFHTSDKIIDRVIEEFNLPKRTQAEELRIVHTHTYGSHESYVEHMTQTQKKTCIELYGVDNYAKTEEFREKSVATFNARYGVNNPMQASEVKQRLSDNCFDKHGVAWPCMLPQAKLGGIGSDSGPNLTFYSELKEYISEENIQREFCIEKFNYDFRVGNILIEVDPSSTHNSTWGVYNSPPKEKTYHSDKTKLAEKHGYRCIHVFDWDKFSNIIQLLVARPRVYARNCAVKEVDRAVTKDFIDKNHLQGYARDSVRFGLYLDDKLVSIMTFDKPRYNKNYQYELVRYCSTHQVIGGAEKLFKHFITCYNPKSIISYCDLSKFTGATYEKLGFKLKGSSISKHWVSMKTGKHITDNLLRQRGFDQLFGTSYGKGTSNEQLMLDNGFVVVYDAGQATYVWKNS